LVGGQWNSWGDNTTGPRGGQNDVQFLIEGGLWTNAPTTDNVKGKYVHDCHCTACYWEIRASDHIFKPDITSCAAECAEDPTCQTVLHDRLKFRCWYYAFQHSQQHSPVPALAAPDTYSELSGGNEFTCWYKTETYTHQNTIPPTEVYVSTNPPTTVPSASSTTYETGTPTTNHFIDVFDSATKGSKIVLSNNDRSATSSNLNHAWNSVYGEHTVSSGEFSWTLNVTSLHDHTANYWEMVIGVAKTTTRGESVFVANQEGMGYIQQNGDKTQSGQSPDHVNYGATYTVGDIIKVHLNLDSNTLSFHKNGVTQGDAFTSISSGTYRLAVMVGDSSDGVSIIA